MSEVSMLHSFNSIIVQHNLSCIHVWSLTCTNSAGKQRYNTLLVILWTRAG